MDTSIRAKRALPQQSFYSSSGARVSRVSTDGAWPLRRADGRTWADHQANYQTPSNPCKWSSCRKTFPHRLNGCEAISCGVD